MLTVSADPLSPERGSYGFAQELLRQVAYDTLSRRDRKARHLTVAAHLRTALTHTSETLPVEGGRLALGTWQGVYLWEHRDRPRARTIVVTIIGR